MKKEIIGNTSTDILNVAKILQGKGLCTDISPLMKTISCFKREQITQLEKLKLHINTVPRNTRPNVESLDIYLNVTVPKISSDDFILSLNDYTFSMMILGMNKEGKMAKSSWHLDYDNSDKAEYVHPHFHLTYGGLSMENISIGDVLLLPTPRIAYPPIDIILGIDFALSNFVRKDLYENIRSDSQYKAAVRHSQIKYWKPYMMSLAHFWCDFTCGEFSTCSNLSKCLNPNLVD